MDSSETVNDRTNDIKRKQHFTGTVLKTNLGGAAVDIGLGVPAFLHISQIKPAEEGQPVLKVEDVLQAGQQVDVWVRKVKEGRVDLTMFKPLDLEWGDIKPGMVAKGKVTKLDTFGAFVDIGAERPGLVHISEMAHGYVRTPGDVVKEGDEIDVQVLDFNRKKKQIKLSMKALQEEPVREEEPAMPMPDMPVKERPNRRRKGRRGEDSRDEYEGRMTFQDEDAEGEPTPTAMEIALREAMERAKGRKGGDKGKRSKGVSTEQEDLLSRTLQNKVRTS